MSEIDFDVKQFARLLARLPEHLEISDAMEEADPQKRLFAVEGVVEGRRLVRG